MVKGNPAQLVEYFHFTVKGDKGERRPCALYNQQNILILYWKRRPFTISKKIRFCTVKGDPAQSAEYLDSTLQRAK